MSEQDPAIPDNVKRAPFAVHVILKEQFIQRLRSDRPHDAQEIANRHIANVRVEYIEHDRFGPGDVEYVEGTNLKKWWAIFPQTGSENADFENFWSALYDLNNPRVSFIQSVQAYEYGVKQEGVKREVPLGQNGH